MDEITCHIVKDPDFPRSEYTDRHKKARVLMEKQDLDALLVLEETNLTYFSGLRKVIPYGSKSRTYMLHFFILPREEDPILIVPLEMRGNAEYMTWIDDIRFFSEIDPIDLLLNSLEELKLTKRNIGCELGERTRLDCSWNDFDTLQKGLPNARIIDAAPLIWELRNIKSSAEIEYLQNACNISQKAMRAGFEVIHEGMTEKDLFTVLCKTSLDEGAADLPLKIDFVVVTGPERHIMYDTRPTNKKMKKGEIVIIDGGVAYKSYWCDFTRLACIGKPSLKQQEMFDTALEAHTSALSTVKAGVPIKDVKNASDGVFRERGYAKQCPDDSCGHGVGLEIHEPPRITLDNKTQLKTGYVLAIEPMIYSTTSLNYMEKGIAKGENTCDFFLEDNIVVTARGFSNLTPMEYDMWIV
ncbi:MAG: M24 family metallopeptidase [Candidatus Hodarchaeota archaeon]